MQEAAYTNREYLAPNVASVSRVDDEPRGLLHSGRAEGGRAKLLLYSPDKQLTIVTTSLVWFALRQWLSVTFAFSCWFLFIYLLTLFTRLVTLDYQL